MTRAQGGWKARVSTLPSLTALAKAALIPHPPHCYIHRRHGQGGAPWTRMGEHKNDHPPTALLTAMSMPYLIGW